MMQEFLLCCRKMITKEGIILKSILNQYQQELEEMSARYNEAYEEQTQIVSEQQVFLEKTVEEFLPIFKIYKEKFKSFYNDEIDQFSSKGPVLGVMEYDGEEVLLVYNIEEEDQKYQ